MSIDAGVQKYVLLRLRDGRVVDGAAPGEARRRSKLLVRGACAAAYHNHIYQAVKAEAARLGLTVEVLGGGRIEHHPDQGVVSVYGYSAAFGAAPHEVTAALIRRWHPFYDPACVTVSYEGY